MHRRLAEKIVVNLGTFSLQIDGDEFPFHLTEDGVDVNDLGNPRALPSATFTVPAKTVEVIPSDAGADA